MLQPGDHANDFAVSDVLNNTLTPSNFEGNYLLISFMRGADCPFCNLRLLELENNDDRMSQLGLVNYLIYHATSEQLLKNMEQMPSPESCRMIPDPNLDLHNLYDTKKSYWGTLLTFLKIGKMIETIRKRVFTLSPIGDPPLIPADFLIDPSGLILMSHYGKDYTDNVYLEDVFKLIETNNLSLNIQGFGVTFTHE